MSLDEILTWPSVNYKKGDKLTVKQLEDVRSRLPVLERMAGDVLGNLPDIWDVLIERDELYGTTFKYDQLLNYVKTGIYKGRYKEVKK